MLWVFWRFILIYEDVKLHKEKSLQIVFIFLISWNLLLNIQLLNIQLEMQMQINTAGLYYLIKLF